MNIITQFATDLLSEKMEGSGFKRKGNAWYKAVPDVLLCVQVRKMSMNSFNLEFGIMPIVCAYPLRPWLTIFQCEHTFNRLFREEVRKSHEELYGRRQRPDNYFYTMICFGSQLNDPKKYSIILDYWNKVFEKTVAPFIFRVNDLESALKVIGDFFEYDISEDAETHQLVHRRKYPSMFMPAFMKLGKIEEAMPYWKPFTETASEDEKDEFEQRIKDALEKEAYCSPYLWYWAMKNNDTNTIEKVIRYLEFEGINWMKKQKLPILYVPDREPLDQDIPL